MQTRKNLMYALLIFLTPLAYASAPPVGPEGWTGQLPPNQEFFRADCHFLTGRQEELALDNDIPQDALYYASALYRVEDKEYKDVHLGVGYESRTLFNDGAQVQAETTLDRIQPFQAETPAIEISPQGQLTEEGTYTSVLDIPLGRFKGVCYVHRVRSPFSK